MAHEDIEKLNVDDLGDLPPGIRTLILILRSLFLELKQQVAQLTATIVELTATIAAKDAENAELRKTLLGRRSERQPRTHPIAPDPEKAAERQAAGQQKRKSSRAAKAKLATEQIDYVAPAACPSCESLGPHTELPPDISFTLELVPARLVRHKHVVHQCVCPGGHVFIGSRPARVGGCAEYGPGLHAEAVVSKCKDALPLNRLSDRLARAGFPIARSVLTDLFHRAAAELRPIYQRIVEQIAEASHVNADETSQPVRAKTQCKNGFIWTFITDSVIAYVFSASRSGETPERILGSSAGSLQVDGHTGYNSVTTPPRRQRSGCLSHCRRYFHKALESGGEDARRALDVIRRLYEVERLAADQNILRTPAHAALRQERSRPILEAWRGELDQLALTAAPKSPLGIAVRYTRNQWSTLIRYLDDPLITPDNNISERALRRIALGRDNFRWVGNDDAGENLAILHTIVATCGLHKVNPNAYIADVLIRVATHPAARLDELLPQNWSSAAA